MALLDWRYNGRDRVVVNGNYSTTSGATSKAARLLMAEYREIGGIGYGCKLWAAIRRLGDTTETRALAERYCLEALQPLIRRGEIEAVTITVDDPQGVIGLGIHVTMRDVRSGQTETIDLPAWGS